jgi:hypothetical protein
MVKSIVTHAAGILSEENGIFNIYFVFHLFLLIFLILYELKLN